MNRPSLPEKIYAYMQQHQMLEEKDKVLAGVSGGADSVCMLLILGACRAKMDLSLQVVHIEHGLRAQESMEDAEFVRQLCRRLDIPCTVVHEDVAALAAREGLTTEEAGRKARYAAFEKLCPEGGKIAVAHNMHDQAETVLFHLARGSGLDGLAGIRPVRGRIIRPLLCCGRDEIEAYLTQLGQTWRTDRTNEETVYSRNLIRHKVLPLLSGDVNAQAVRHICEAAELVGEAGRYLDSRAQAFMDTHVRLYTGEEADAIRQEAGARRRQKGRMPSGQETGMPSGQEAGTTEKYSVNGLAAGPVAIIDLLSFREEDSLIQEYVLRRTIQLVKQGNALKDLGLIHIRDLAQLAFKPSGKRLDLPGRLKAVRRAKQMLLFVEQ